MREISLHILDIAQNSVAAGASVITVSIEENREGDSLLVSIIDDGRGMDEETAAKVTDPFFTTRTTGRVGLGLPMLKATALACEGSFDLKSRPGEGTAVSVSFRRSHIDRPPLGDMVSTVRALLLGSEGIDFIYRHRCGGRLFAFASRDMREALDGLPFSHPEVYRWLSAFLAEGEEELRCH